MSKIVKLETGYRAPITRVIKLRNTLLRAQGIASYNLEASPEKDAVVATITEALKELDENVGAISTFLFSSTEQQKIAS